MKDRSHKTQAHRIAITGCGGFARKHHKAILNLEKRGLVKLVATCDPNPQQRSNATHDFNLNGRGVKQHESFESMLTENPLLDLVTLPTPLPLHASMHATLVKQEIPVYLEKPPTLYPVELEQMLQVEKLAKIPTTIGFNYIHEDNRRELKQRILAGEFGKLHSVGFIGHWSRPMKYYARNFWAGKLFTNGYPNLDNPAGNAFSHFLHNLLHWAGLESMNHWAKAHAVQAHYYRTQAIESADTLFLKARLDSDVELRFAVSHTWNEQLVNREILQFDKHRILYDVNQGYQIELAGKAIETGIAHPHDHLETNLIAACELRTSQNRRPTTSLADTVPFVELQALGLIATGKIKALPETDIEYQRDNSDSSNQVPVVAGLAEKMEHFVQTENATSDLYSSSKQWVQLNDINFKNSIHELNQASA